jgi:hypothetical protein
VYGPVRTVVWQGSAGDRRPYADQTGVDLLRIDGIDTVTATTAISEGVGI